MEKINAKHSCELIRHGHGTDEGLSEEGVLQVKVALPTLKCPDLIIVSPARRSEETGKLIFQYFQNLQQDLEIKVVEDFDEVKISSKAATDIKIYHESWGNLWDEGHAGFEPVSEYLKRIKNAFQSIPQNKNVLIVGHEETVWAYIALAKNMPLEKIIKTNIPCASIHKIKLPIPDI